MSSLFASSSASASIACSEWLVRPSVYQASEFTIIEQLQNRAADLEEAFRQNHELISLEALKTEIAALESLAEAYFKIAGISFKKEKFETQNFTYNIYKIEGSPYGDEIARMFYGIQVKPRPKEQSLGIIFDIFYGIKNPGKLSHYYKEANTFYVGPDNLIYFVAGIAATFRHETQHFFESQKVQEGKMSLARFSFKGLGNSSLPYGNFLSADEIETHLRDFRSMTNFNRLAIIDAKLPKSLLANIVKSERATILSEKFEIFKRNLKSTRSIIEKLEIIVANKAWSFNDVKPTQNGVEVYFFLEESSYQFVQVNLTGLLKSGESQIDGAQIQVALEQVLSWSRSRLLQVESEVARYEVEAKKFYWSQ